MCSWIANRIWQNTNCWMTSWTFYIRPCQSLWVFVTVQIMWGRTASLYHSETSAFFLDFFGDYLTAQITARYYVPVLVRKGGDEWQDSRYTARAPPPPPARSVGCHGRRFNGRNAASQRRFEAPSPGGERLAPALSSEQRIEWIKGLGKVVGPPVWKRHTRHCHEDCPTPYR